MLQLPERGYLAVDVGTSSVRAAVIAENGSLVGIRSSPTPRPAGAKPGEATLDGRDCWRLTAQTIREVVAHCSGTEISAVGVSAQLAMVVVDHSLEPVTPVILWADRTAAARTASVQEALAAPGAPVTGRRTTAELTAVRLQHMLTRQDRALDRAAHVLSLKDYLVGCLTSEVVTDPTHASYTLLYDIERLVWAEELAARLAIPGRLLPAVHPAAARAGTVTTSAAAACGLRPGLDVAVGGPDGTVGSVGAGATRAGRTVDIAGSTDVLVHVVAQPLVDPTSVITTNVHAVEHLWTVGGATGLTGGALPWLAATLGYPDVAEMHERLESNLATMPPGSRGVLFDSALTGHRFPFWDAATRGSIRGLAPEHGAAEIVNAAHEGCAFLVQRGLGELARLGERPDAVTVVGGAARRAASLRLRADVWGVVVEGVADGMATSRGAAMLASVAAGHHADLEEATRAMVPAGTKYDPDPRRHAELRDAAMRWVAEFAPKSSAKTVDTEGPSA